MKAAPRPRGEATSDASDARRGPDSASPPIAPATDAAARTASATDAAVRTASAIDADLQTTPARSVRFSKQVLSDQFVAEGATFGDFNRDGTLDVIAGSHWYEGPDFARRFEFRAARAFDPASYSDSFLSFVYDFNGDGWADLLTYGFPGDAATWYENPEGNDQHWRATVVWPTVDNESATFLDLTGSPSPEMVFNNSGYFGWAAPSSADYTLEFIFTPLSEAGNWSRFTHGLGVGDVNADGRQDVIAREGVWLQPASLSSQAWTFEAHDFGAGGAQMFAYDVDGDGDQDVLTTLEAHGYGVAWFEQLSEGGKRRFVGHTISGTPEFPGPSEVVLHEPHALALVDVDGDCLLDLVTGERFWAHVPARMDLSAPAQLVWFRLQRTGEGVVYEPHQIDEQSGVGTQVVAQPLAEGEPASVVVANKKGVFLFRAAFELPVHHGGLKQPRAPQEE